MKGRLERISPISWKRKTEENKLMGCPFASNTQQVACYIRVQATNIRDNIRVHERVYGKDNIRVHERSSCPVYAFTNIFRKKIFFCQKWSFLKEKKFFFSFWTVFSTIWTTVFFLFGKWPILGLSIFQGERHFIFGKRPKCWVLY